MRYYLLIILACLLLVVPATAVTSNLPVVSCSADTFEKSPTANIIWVTFMSGPGNTLIDGEAKMPMWGESWGGTRPAVSRQHG